MSSRPAWCTEQGPGQSYTKKPVWQERNLEEYSPFKGDLISSVLVPRLLKLLQARNELYPIVGYLHIVAVGYITLYRHCYVEIFRSMIL